MLERRSRREGGTAGPAFGNARSRAKTRGACGCGAGSRMPGRTRDTPSDPCGASRPSPPRPSASSRSAPARRPVSSACSTRLVIRSLPVERPHRLVWFREPAFSYPIFAEAPASRLPVFDGVFGWNLDRAYVDWSGARRRSRRGGRPRNDRRVLLRRSACSAAAGRTFDASDTTVAVISSRRVDAPLRSAIASLVGRTIRVGPHALHDRRRGASRVLRRRPRPRSPICSCRSRGRHAAADSVFDPDHLVVAAHHGAAEGRRQPRRRRTRRCRPCGRA